MGATLEEKKEKLRRKGEVFLKLINVNSKEGALDSLLDLLTDDYVDIRDLHQNKADESDIKELIIEMREGFKRMDRRFEDMQKSMDKRFEAVDRRFEDIQRSTDRRFEDMQRSMDKRFEAVDRRFEDMNKRFNSMQWMMGFGFTVIVIITTLYKFVH